MSDDDLWADRPNPAIAAKQRVGKALEDYFAKRRGELEAEQRKAAKVQAKSKPNFSTTYAVEWAIKQGYVFVEREHYVSAGDRRFHVDLPGGSDVHALDGSTHIYIQAGGKGQKDEHYRRFLDRRDKLSRLDRFVYLEFERGNRVPTLREDWQ